MLIKINNIIILSPNYKLRERHWKICLNQSSNNQQYCWKNHYYQALNQNLFILVECLWSPMDILAYHCPNESPYEQKQQYSRYRMKNDCGYFKYAMRNEINNILKTAIRRILTEQLPEHSKVDSIISQWNYGKNPKKYWSNIC